MNAIIGSQGFIGSRLKQYVDTHIDEKWVGINRDNYDEWASSSVQWNKVAWAAGMSSKPKCLDDKDKCFEANVARVAKAVRDFNPRKFIYISSFDVYPDPKNTKEEVADSIPLYGETFNGLSWYGQTKLQGERCVKEAKSFLIVRCNGFTGPGLKKNVVYDIANDDNVWVSLDSQFQYMHTDTFAHLLFQIDKIYYNEIFNFTSKDVVTPVNIAMLLGKDVKKIKQPTDKNVSLVKAVMDVSKLNEAITYHRLYFPTSKEAVKSWNEPIKVPMHQMRDTVGEL